MATTRSKVHLLDVGTQKYGDCVLYQFGEETVLIDGAHASDTEHIAAQIDDILNEPNHISLLIITHAHGDHIGCIPQLVANGDIEVERALVPDPDLGFGRPPGSDFHPPDAETAVDRRRRVLAQALREEDRSDVSDEELREFLDAVEHQEQDYRDFIEALETKKVEVVRFGTESTTELVKRFKTIGLRIIGPKQPQIDAAAEYIRNAVDFTEGIAADVLAKDAEIDLVEAYRALAGAITDSGKARPGAAINMTSIVTLFEVDDKKFLCAGDMEFEKPDPPLPSSRTGSTKCAR